MNNIKSLKAQIRAINKKIIDNTFKTEKGLYKAKNKVKTLEKTLIEQIKIHKQELDAIAENNYWEKYASY